ncbi:hypothetical protein AAY473_017304 [Plecturocebus cupreus]
MNYSTVNKDPLRACDTQLGTVQAAGWEHKDGFSLCGSGWSAVAQSPLTANHCKLLRLQGSSNPNSASQVAVITVACHHDWLPFYSFSRGEVLPYCPGQSQTSGLSSGALTRPAAPQPHRPQPSFASALRRLVQHSADRAVERVSRGKQRTLSCSSSTQGRCPSDTARGARTSASQSASPRARAQLGTAQEPAPRPRPCATAPPSGRSSNSPTRSADQRRLLTGPGVRRGPGTTTSFPTRLSLLFSLSAISDKSVNHCPESSYFMNASLRSLTLSSRLECGGAILAHCKMSPHLLGLSDSPPSASQVAEGAHHHTWPIFTFSVEMGFHHVGQTGLELLTSSDLPSSASQSAGITGESHCGQQVFRKNLTRLEIGYCSVTLAGVWWCDHSSLWSQYPGTKASSCLSLTKTKSAYVAQAGLELLASSDLPASASQSIGVTGMSHHVGLYSCLKIAIATIDMRFYHVGQAGLEYLTPGDPPTSASQSAGITGTEDSKKTSLQPPMIPSPMTNQYSPLLKPLPDKLSLKTLTDLSNNKTPVFCTAGSVSHFVTQARAPSWLTAALTSWFHPILLHQQLKKLRHQVTEVTQGGSPSEDCSEVHAQCYRPQALTSWTQLILLPQPLE